MLWSGVTFSHPLKTDFILEETLINVLMQINKIYCNRVVMYKPKMIIYRNVCTIYIYSVCDVTQANFPSIAVIPQFYVLYMYSIHKII